MTKLVPISVLAVLASIALVACGGGDDETTTTDGGGGAAATTTTGGGGGGGGGGASTLKLAADPSQIAYDTDSLSAQAGSVTIDFDNPNDALPHDVCVESGGEDVGCSDTVTGDSTTLDLNDLNDLKAGSYTFYCSVDAHRAAGMEGTLQVQ